MRKKDWTKNCLFCQTYTGLSWKWNDPAHEGRIRISCGMRTNQRRHKANVDDMAYTVHWRRPYFFQDYLGLDEKGSEHKQ